MSKPIPDVDQDSRAWWNALDDGRIEVPRCAACDRYFFPPQPGCPHCGSAAWTLVPTDGAGTLYSWVVVHLPFDPAFADEVPYAIVAVDLDEGPRMIGRFTGPDLTLAAGLRLQACAYRSGTQALLGFAPASSSTEGA